MQSFNGPVLLTRYILWRCLWVLSSWLELSSHRVNWNGQWNSPLKCTFQENCSANKSLPQFFWLEPTIPGVLLFYMEKGWDQEWAWPTKKTGIERAWARDICLYFGRYDSWGLLLNLMTSYWLDHTPSVMSLWAWLLETSHFLTEFFKI